MNPEIVAVVTYWIAFVTVPKDIYPDWIEFEADAIGCGIYLDKVFLRETRSGFTYLLKLQREFCPRHASYYCRPLEHTWVFCFGSKFRKIIREARAIKANWNDLKSRATTARRR